MRGDAAEREAGTSSGAENATGGDGVEVLGGDGAEVLGGDGVEVLGGVGAEPEPEGKRVGGLGTGGSRGAGSDWPAALHRWWPTAVVGGVLVALLLAWAGWLLAGGGLFWVSSSSMGETIPEGSLVASMPIPASQPIRTGEVVVFREPGTTNVFVHRVVQVLPGERYLTKGDLERNPDPWVLQRSGVIGGMETSIPGVGWIYHSATWLFLGAAILVGTSMYAGRRTRRWIGLLGPVVLIAVPLLRYRPLVDGYVLQSTQHGAVGTAHIVDSGVLPVHFAMHGGRSVYAAPGQAVDVLGKVPSGGTGLHGVPIHIAAALPWWGWLLVVVVCLSPLLVLEVDVRRRHALALAMAPVGPAAPAEAGVGDDGAAAT